LDFSLPLATLKKRTNEMSLPQTAPQSKTSYTILPDSILDSPQALELSGNAYAMLIDFWRAWQRATRNGRRRILSITWTSADYPRKITRPTFDKARRELEVAGFIHCIRREWGRWAWGPKLENTPCKETLHPIRHYGIKTTKAESSPETRVFRPETRRIEQPSNRHGPPRTIGDILRIGDFGELDLALRIERLTGEGHWRSWWRRVLEAMGKSGCVPEFEGWLKYAEDCQNPRIRRLKDLGELHKPGAFLVSKALTLQHRYGFHWPDYPGGTNDA